METISFTHILQIEVQYFICLRNENLRDTKKLKEAEKSGRTDALGKEQAKVVRHRNERWK